MDNKLGAGGGAGGSIQIITKNIRGDGNVSLKGGNGHNGGGGGSGGRAVINFLASYMADSYPEQSYFWEGTINLDGGDGGLYDDGQEEHANSEVADQILQGFGGGGGNDNNNNRRPNRRRNETEEEE
jgi:hypothetical protein